MRPAWTVRGEWWLRDGLHCAARRLMLRYRWRWLAERLRLREAEDDSMRRFRETFELHDLGTAMYTQRMRNQHPDETPRQIGARVLDWLRQPGCIPDHEIVLWSRRKETVDSR